jgi:hypothetical protein
MNEVGRRAEAELPEEAVDALLDDDERLESDPGRVATSGAPDDFFEASRLERRAAFESAVRNVRRAYADEMARARVPSSSLEVAALAAHLRRPISVIRGPSRPPRAATRESNPSAEGADDDIGEADASASPASAWRARCASETFGAAHARRGRRGFTVFWELAENVPDGLPAGDFSLLLPRRETRESRVEGRERFSSSRGRRRSFAASDDDRFSRGVSSEEDYSEYSYPPNARATFSDADTLTDDADVSDVSDADVSSVSSVDDLLRGRQRDGGLDVVCLRREPVEQRERAVVRSRERERARRRETKGDSSGRAFVSLRRRDEVDANDETKARARDTRDTGQTACV